MYHTIFIDHQGRFAMDQRGREARICHLMAAVAPCPRKGIRRRCAPAVMPPRATR